MAGPSAAARARASVVRASMAAARRRWSWAALLAIAASSFALVLSSTASRWEGRVELRACCFELYSEYSSTLVTRTASDDQQFGIFWSSKRGAVALSARTSLPAHDEFLGRLAGVV